MSLTREREKETQVTANAHMDIATLLGTHFGHVVDMFDGIGRVRWTEAEVEIEGFD